MMRMLLSAVIAVLLCSAPLSAEQAGMVTPFFTRNLSPLVQIFGLPPTEGGVLSAPYHLSARLVAEVASHASADTAGAEEVRFDGETSRATLALRYGLGPRWEVGIDVPLVSHDGGIFDSFVEGWHDFFNLPQGGRDTGPRDRLHYLYSRGGNSVLDYDRSGGGFGDLSLGLAYQLVTAQPGSQRALALRGGIKLPTGDADRLRGSGATDVHLRLSGSDAQTLAPWNLTLFASAGILHLERGDVLSEQQRRWVGFGSAGIGWMPQPWIDLKLQLDGHSSFYRDSRLRQIDAASLQLGMGGSLHLGKQVTLDLAVTEDLLVDTAPDVVFHSGLTWRF
ncbi:MAG: DUF3187 family protein [Pelovirga sp.]